MFIALSILSFGIFAALAACIADLSLGFISGSFEPNLAATVISFESLENIRYEGFGPEKIAVIVEALTDNKNRTASQLRTIFNKNGGNLGSSGSASHNFNQVGVIRIDKNEIKEDQILELAIEAGAEECFNNKDFHEIHCDKKSIYSVKKKLEEKIANFISTEIEWIPNNKIVVNKDNLETANNFLEDLDNNDDVQNIYTNLDLADN